MNSIRNGIILGLLITSLSLRAEIEKWTRGADGVTISAELVNFDPATNKVTLKLQNGAEAVIDGAILVEDNQQRLARHAKEVAAKREASKIGRLESVDVENGGGYKMHIYRPAGYIDGDNENKSRPVVFVYGPGENAMWILNLLKPGADELGWVMVGVDAYCNKRLRAQQRVQVIKDSKAAYEDARKRVVFDGKKVVFGGFSGGAYWSYQSSLWLEKNTAGIVAIGGVMNSEHSNNYSKNMAVAIVNGVKDKENNDHIKPDTQCLENNKATVKLFTYNAGHTLPKPEIALAAMRWIHETKIF